MAKKLYIGGVSYNTTQQGLQEAFEKFGKVVSAQVIMDKMTNQSRGFGFVEMSDDAAAKKAIAELDGATIEGRNIKVMEAKPKEDRPARSNGGGGYGGGNRGGNSGGGGYNNRY